MVKSFIINFRIIFFENHIDITIITIVAEVETITIVIQCQTIGTVATIMVVIVPVTTSETHVISTNEIQIRRITNHKKMVRQVFHKRNSKVNHRKRQQLNQPLLQLEEVSIPHFIPNAYNNLFLIFSIFFYCR